MYDRCAIRVAVANKSKSVDVTGLLVVEKSVLETAAFSVSA